MPLTGYSYLNVGTSGASLLLAAVLLPGLPTSTWLDVMGACDRSRKSAMSRRRADAESWECT